MTTAEPPPRPSLTLHVLDVSRGRPAAGVRFALARLTGADAGPLVEAATSDDGRSAGALLEGPTFTAGTYELAFEIGAYFATDGPRFLDVVPIRFGVDSSDGHVHVALLVTPWSYTTYRGS